MQKKVLIVDDDPAIVESLQLVLEDSGFEVITAEDGTFTNKKFFEKKPDIILLDYWLPGENGGEITRRLKMRSHTKDIPIIIISASYNIKELVTKAGADDFLAKPYNIEDLIQIVNKHIPN